MKHILTKMDTIRLTLWRMAVAVGSTITLTSILLAIAFGPDFNQSISLKSVAIASIIIGSAVSALLAGLLTYRSGRTMRELNQARAHLLRLSHTDQLTGLLTVGAITPPR